MHNPAVLAKQALTVDRVSGGRLELGIGAGGAETDHTMTGIPDWNLRERAVRLREVVEIRPSNKATTVAWSNAAQIGRRSNAWPQR